MTPSRCSVALCTFSRARYLPGQLDGILRHTRPPDEVVASDEGPTDGTLNLLRAFAAWAPFPARVVSQPRRLGPAANFGTAIALCEGD